VRIVGYTAEDLLAIDFQTITHPDDLDADARYLRQMLGGSTSHFDVEKRFFHKDGHVLWVFCRFAGARRRGRPLYFVSQIQDTTEQKLLTDDLRLARADLQASSIMSLPNHRLARRLDQPLFEPVGDGAIWRVRARVGGQTCREIIGEERYRIAEPTWPRSVRRAAIVRAGRPAAGRSRRYSQSNTCLISGWPSHCTLRSRNDVTELRESHQRIRELAHVSKLPRGRTAFDRASAARRHRTRFVCDVPRPEACSGQAGGRPDVDRVTQEFAEAIDNA